MNCRKANSLLSAYIDGELPGVEHLQIREHLRVCERCCAEYESLVWTKRLLASLKVQEPCADLEQQILDRIAHEERQPSPRRPWQGWFALLSPAQQRSVRLGLICATAALSALLLAILPATPGRPVDSLARDVGPRPIRMAEPSLPSGVPVNDYWFVHNPREPVRPEESRFRIIPAGNAYSAMDPR